jgi:regulator of sirC expression with transglutaminase-like and TPR domain
VSAHGSTLGCWRRIAAAPAEEVSLVEGALLLAAEEYPGLDIDHYVRRLDELALGLRRRLRPDIGTAEALLALNRYLFDELGYAGNTDDYYDPRNSFLNEVIDRRLGIPITLAVLYIEIGRRIGLTLQGVAFPGHFLVRCTLAEGLVVIDPYGKGASLDVHELQTRLKNAGGTAPRPTPELTQKMLAPAPPKAVLARMLRNLRVIYSNRGEYVKALVASERILLLLPEAAEDYRDRAELYAALDCARGAVDDFRVYLQLRPDAPDAGAVQRRIAELEPQAVRLH